MEVLAASVIAVLGTLLGAAATHRYQLRSAQLAARTALAEKTRQERLDAYATYGGALMDYRRSLIDYCFAKREGQPEEDRLTLRRESFQLRSVAQEALFRIELLSENTDLIQAGRDALNAVATVYECNTREALRERRDASRSAVYAFITAAKGHISLPATTE